jgi:hypothetical protein
MGVEKDLASLPAGAAAGLSEASLLRPHRAGPELEHRNPSPLHLPPAP